MVHTSQIVDRKLLLFALLLIFSVEADGSFLRRQNATKKLPAQLSLETIFGRKRKTSHPKKWQTITPFYFLKGNRDDEENGGKDKSSGRLNLAAKAEQAQSKLIQSLDDIKHSLQESMDTTYRPWIMERRLRHPNASISLTTSLVFANVIMYGLQMFLPSITRAGTKRSDLILRGRELHRLVTPVFLHGNIPHLLMNTYSLQNIGPEVEKLFGPGRFLATYMVAGVAGNLLSAMNTPNPSLGASGAIFGLLGAYYTFLNRNGSLFGRSASMQMDNVGRTLFMNIIFGLASPGIDNWGHIGGAIGGAVMAYYIGPKLFIAQLPNGSRMIVDKPTFRLPRALESIPERIGKNFTRLKRRMQVESELTLHRSKSKPWRRFPERRRSSWDQWRPRRPIKPLFKD